MIDMFGIVQRTTFFALLIGITLMFIWVLKDLIMPLFWATVFAVLFRPVYLFLSHHLRGRKALSSLLTIFIALIVIFVPIYFVGDAVTEEAVDLYFSIEDQERDVSPEAIIERIPYAETVMSTLALDAGTLTSYATTIVQTISGWVATQAISIGSNTIAFALQFVLMLYVLFFLFKDGEKLGKYIIHMLPLGDIKEHLLFGRFVSTTRAIIKGTVIVALVQGSIGGILFAIAGIPNPFLWGVVMALFALIPAVGPSVIWAPAAIISLATGNVFGGLVILVGGVAIVGLVDNVLRPILVGRDTEMPDALVLLSILGGITSFGIAGVVIGPVIAALFLSVWDLFGKEFATELETRG